MLWTEKADKRGQGDVMRKAVNQSIVETIALLPMFQGAIMERRLRQYNPVERYSTCYKSSGDLNGMLGTRKILVPCIFRHDYQTALQPYRNELLLTGNFAQINYEFLLLTLDSAHRAMNPQLKETLTR